MGEIIAFFTIELFGKTHKRQPEWVVSKDELCLLFLKGNELLKPSVTTKLCLLLALGICGVDQGSNVSDIIYLIAIGLFVSVKLSVIFGEPVDPLAPLEKLVCNVLAAVSGHNSATPAKKTD